jgi:thioesterase DpgC
VASTVTREAVARWASATASPTGRLAEDAAALARFVAQGERFIGSLPVKAARDDSAQRLADDVHAACRDVRRGFLARHTEGVYDELTAGRTRYPRLPELVYAAADRYPGLVPTRAQIDAELLHIQAHKEGREIDQGLFCGAVLRSAAAGRHLIDAMLLPTRRSRELVDAFRGSGRLELPSVLVERRGTVAYVTFRNAHSLNAEDNRLIADLETAVDIVLLDDQVHVGVLRGGHVDHPRYRGRRVFSAGINLHDLRNGNISFVDFLMSRELGYIHKMLRGLSTAPADGSWPERTVQKPWIGAVDTFALGGGMQLLLVLDKVIVDSAAFLGLPAADEGIVPGVANLRLTRLTGGRLARQVILGGRRIHATDPEVRLLCDEVVTTEAMDEAIERAARELDAPAVAANRRFLSLAEEPLDLFREYLAEFAVAQVGRAYSHDVLAKVERRWQQSRARERATA